MQMSKYSAFEKEIQQNNERLMTLNDELHRKTKEREPKWREIDALNSRLQGFEKSHESRTKFLRSLSPIIRVVLSVAIVVVLGLLFPYLDGFLYLPLMGFPILVVNLAFPAIADQLESMLDGNSIQQSIRIKEERNRIIQEISRINQDIDRIKLEIEEIKSREREIQFEIESELQRKKDEEERMLTEKKIEEFREKIQREELAADERMSRSALVHEIAQRILPTFKRIVEKVDTEAHLKVRVRLALEVRADTIDYYDAADPQNLSSFIFKEEGIAEKLSPILRKALCKALVTELSMLILEAFPIDPEFKIVQADLEGSVVLKSNVTYVPGRDYTAPEYDANSHAYAVILYQASKDKAPIYF